MTIVQGAATEGGSSTAASSPASVPGAAPRGDMNAEQQRQLIEQYKLFVQMADQTSERRSKSNTFYMTLHTAVYGAIWALLLRQYDSLATANWALTSLPFFLLAMLCVCWWFTVRSYDLLNGAKFQIVGEIEQLLPVQPWSEEWRRLKSGKDWRAYLPLSKIDRWVPVVVGVCDLFSAGVVAYKICNG